MSATDRYRELLVRGCLCGRAGACPIHKPGDNRGLAAYFRAGMPEAFPTPATCATCGANGLLYPNVSESQSPPRHHPTLICPHCSTPETEALMLATIHQDGYHQLNSARVFAAAASAGGAS